MSEQPKLSKVELLKEASHQLRGTLGEEILNDKPEFSDDAATLLKHHGSYLQDDRDTRKAKGADGKLLGKHYSCMVRTRIPGGRVTAAQFLAELDLCERLASGTLRITSRQGFQLHGVLKGDLREAIRAINESKLTTLAACGDVNRNVMACPAPFKSRVYEQMQTLSQELAEHFKPRTRAYYDLWLKDENGEFKPRIVVFKDREVVFYGKPSEYKSEQQSSTPNSASVQNHNTNTNTINPAITIGATNVTVNPVITVVPIEADATQNKRIPSSGSNYFHSVPTADEHHNSTQEGQ